MDKMDREIDTTEWRELLENGPASDSLRTIDSLLDANNHETTVEIGTDSYEAFEIKSEQLDSLHLFFTEEPESFNRSVSHPGFEDAEDKPTRFEITGSLDVIFEFDEGYERAIDLELTRKNLDVKVPTRDSFWMKKLGKGLEELNDKSKSGISSLASLQSDFDSYVQDFDIQSLDEIKDYKKEIFKEIGSGRSPDTAIAAVYRALTGTKYDIVEEKFGVSDSSVRDALNSMDIEKKSIENNSHYLKSGEGHKIERTKLENDRISPSLKENIYSDTIDKLSEEINSKEGKNLDELSIIKALSAHEDTPSFDSDVEKIKYVQDMVEEFTSAVVNIEIDENDTYKLIPTVERIPERVYRLHDRSEDETYSLKHLAWDIHNQFEGVLSREESAQVYQRMQRKASETPKVSSEKIYDEMKKVYLE